MGTGPFMPAHNFMIEDLTGALKAICFFPLFLFFPGYAAGWLLDLFDFRRRTAGFRATLSLPLSIALCPIISYLLARHLGFGAVWGFYGLAAAVSLGLIVGDLIRGNLRRPFWPEGSRAFAAVVCIWLVVALMSLIDLQMGDRLYYPASVVDYAVRSAFVQSISVTGVPPANPFFYPAHPVTLRYHYFWLLMCSPVERASGVTARQTLIGGTFWAGMAVLALLAAYLRLYAPGTSPLRRRLLVGAALLAITGLDIVPSLFFWFLYGRGWVPFAQPGVELWNEHVEWFLSTTISTPHAMTALVSCFMAFLLLSHAAGARRYIVPAALALASAAGQSVYVALVFALFLGIWTAITLWKRWYRELTALCLAGAASVVLAHSYLSDLAGPGTGESPVQFTVREFSLAALIRTGHLPAIWRRILVNGTMLPLNYLLEFGLFFLVARYQWRQHRASGRPLSRNELALAIMALTSTLACTFLRSGVIGNNDLGWRGFLIAQFVLVLWAVDIFGDRERLAFLTAHQRQLLCVFFALGFAGTVTDIAIIRFYPLMCDRGIVPPLEWMQTSGGDTGRLTYAARSAYEWLQHATPPSATVQSDLNGYQDTLGMTYSDRPTVASTVECLTGFGGDPGECRPVVSRLQQLFPHDGGAAASGIQDACDNLALSVLVAKSSDPAWRDRSSWVWRERPIYANESVRLFGCRVRTAAR